MQAQDELDLRIELRRRNPNTVALREIEKLQVVVDGRQGSLDAALANKATQQTRIASSLPAQKASAEAALAQAQVELDKTLVKAGVDGMVQQFTLRPGDVVNPMIRTGGNLVPEAHREGLVAGFSQIEAQVMKVGMIAEATCIGKPFAILPMVVIGGAAGDCRRPDPARPTNWSMCSRSPSRGRSPSFSSRSSPAR